MKLTACIKLDLTTEEKATLRDAAEIITKITDALHNNWMNGNAAFQEGLNAPECFWEIYNNCLKIESEKLIP